MKLGWDKHSKRYWLSIDGTHISQLPHGHTTADNLPELCKSVIHSHGNKALRKTTTFYFFIRGKRKALTARLKNQVVTVEIGSYRKSFK